MQDGRKRIVVTSMHYGAVTEAGFNKGFGVGSKYRAVWQEEA